MGRKNEVGSAAGAAPLPPNEQRLWYRPGAPIILCDIAAQLCLCHFTDGFCHPRDKDDDCRCWQLARNIHAALHRLHKTPEYAGWDITHKAYLAKDKADPKEVWAAMLDAKPYERDKLTPGASIAGTSHE